MSDDVVLRIAPKEIDRASVLDELEHRWPGHVATDGYPPMSWVLEQLADLDIVRFREPVDDPSKDLTGSIRHTGTITCIARERDDGFDYHRWIAVELNEAFTDEHMRGSKVIGAVPGTPAAEAQAAPTPGPRCGTSEGTTGITCGLARFHDVDVDHEGTDQPLGLAHALFVRWPWQTFDRDYSEVQP